jgi:hypothetical protein
VNVQAEFIKEIVAARIIVGSSISMTDSNQQYEYVDLKVGDRVECRYKGRPRYLPGVISAMNPTNDSFTVLYDDKKMEHNVHRMCIRPVELQRKSNSRSNSGNSSNQTDDETDATTTSTSVQRTMEIIILIIGIDGAGKTTLLSTLQGDLEKEHVPSAGFTSVAFQTETGLATFYDLGGGPAFRNVWREYYADVSTIGWRSELLSSKLMNTGFRPTASCTLSTRPKSRLFTRPRLCSTTPWRMPT